MVAFKRAPMNNRLKSYLLILCLLVSFFSAKKAFSDGTVSMSVEVKNTTDEKELNMPIRQDLPREIRRGDIRDAGGLDVKYDEEKAIYYLYAETDIEPQSSKSYKVTLNDLWKIQDSDFKFLKEQIEERLTSLKGKDNYEAGQKFRDKLMSQAEEIKVSQEAEIHDTEKRMDLFRTNTQKFSELRQKVSVLDDFVKEAVRYAEVQKDNKFIKFVIEVKNPSDTDPAEQVEVTRYLPRGIEPDQITETQGFKVKYDPDKGSYFLTNLIDFKAGETKKFEITISNIWSIPDTKLDELADTEKFTSQIKNTPYESLGNYLSNEIKRLSSEIKETQGKAQTAEDKVATYAESLKKLDLIADDIEQLKRLVDNLDKSKSTSKSESVKVKAPDVQTTWKLIYATIALLVVVALSFYFLWWGQIKVKQNQKVDIINLPKKEN